MNPLTTEAFFLDTVEEEILDIESMREIQCEEDPLLLRWGKAQSKTLRAAWRRCDPGQSVRKKGVSALWLQWTELHTHTQKWMKLEADSFPELPDEKINCQRPWLELWEAKSRRKT